MSGLQQAVAQCADTTVRIMTWNLLNFPSQSNLVTDTTTRLPCYRTVLNYVNPDILVTQENSASNSITFIMDALNSAGNEYSAGAFINGYDSDNGIFFRTSCFRFLSNVPIQTALRDVNQFTLVHIATNDTIHIFSCHLKASPGAANEDLRAAETDSIRKVTNAFLPGTDFILCGDFNFYGSYEPAYSRLLENDSSSDGEFHDAIVMNGTWNDPAYSIYHTQSPRVRSFGGGATGGLDDRFDMILLSSAVEEPGRITYQTGTMTPVGNDGLHYSDSINRPPNAAVSQAVADALHCASDHLPVFAEFDFSPVIGINEVAEKNSAMKIFPNPSSDNVFVSFNALYAASIQIIIYDQFARALKVISDNHVAAGKYERQISYPGDFPPGNYFVKIVSGDAMLCSGIFTKN